MSPRSRPTIAPCSGTLVPMPWRRAHAIAAALIVTVLCGEAHAQGRGKPKPPSPAAKPTAPPPSVPPTDTSKEEAKAHFDKGIKLLTENAWDAALAEFVRSRELYPTKAATKNAAIALRELKRFDDALDMLEGLVRQFPQLSEEERRAFAKEMSELRGLVGSVDIRVAETAATVSVDGNDRGTTPLLGAVRVPAGSHYIRVFKQGFAPFERRIVVAGGESRAVDVKLEALTESGRLTVTESAGRKVTVFVDNAPVGPAPWSGQLPVGAHSVVLRGEGTLGTPPVSAPVKRNETTPLSLKTEDLDAQIRVEPNPAAATVTIDGVAVGRGAWEGRLRAGEHSVDVTVEGFLAGRRSINLGTAKREVVAITLERDLSAPMWREVVPPAFAFELRFGPAFAPSFASALDDGCTSSCSGGVAVGSLTTLDAGYRFGSGFGIALELGYLSMRERLRDRPAELTPNGLAPSAGFASDDVHLRGGLAGLSFELQRGTAVRIGARLGAGVLLASVSDTRSGTFMNTEGAGATPYSIVPVRESASGQYAYAAPRLKVGFRMRKFLELGFGVTGLFGLALSRPTWPDSARSLAGDCTGQIKYPRCLGTATFGADSLAGSPLIVLAPEVTLRFELQYRAVATSDVVGGDGGLDPDGQGVSTTTTPPGAVERAGP